MKVSFFLPVFALAARVAMAAMPPACLLHAVNTQDDPANMSAVCGSSNAPKVQSAIASMCSGDAASAAQSAFIATCSGAGVKVASYTATASPTPTGTRSGSYLYTTAVYNSSCSCTQTIVTSADGAKATYDSPTASRSGSSGAAVSTAGAIHAQQKMGGYAAAAIALVGAVAAL